MFKIFLFLFAFLGGLLSGSLGLIPAEGNSVTFDYAMVEKGIEWLELIESGATGDEIKTFFLDQVATTAGCRSIIHHWERFRKWDTEEFYDFIMTALGRIPTESRIENQDGTLTSFGRRRRAWLRALRNTEQLTKDLELLRTHDLKKSIALAKEYLPREAQVGAQFYFVLFGASNAFSVGRENGYDVLQLPRTGDSLDMESIVRTLAHEIHHTGFDFLQQKYLGDVQNIEKILLVGLLAAEGMPTFYIDKPWFQVKYLARKSDPAARQLALDWEKHSARIKTLYQEAEEDIRLNLLGKKDQAAIMQTWMAGFKGPAYVLGADMISVIDGYLGREAAFNVAQDYRKLLRYYNMAAQKANSTGMGLPLFDEDLAMSVARFNR